MVATDEELEKQAEEMAKKALPESLPALVRTAKLPAVKQKILDRLKAQRTERAANAQAVVPAVKQVASGLVPGAGSPPPPPSSSNPRPPVVAPPPPPPPGELVVVSWIDGCELGGDEPWFADTAVRRNLRESCVEAHKEQKILVGPPADEVDRICPTDGHTLGAGAVLRLGGARVGGYGEGDIAYAYRQLSRALHPDKNPDLAKAPAAFHRLSQAASELREGLSEQRASLQLLVAAMGGQATSEMLERPQEALFAEACRVLVAVCGAAGEGAVPVAAQSRAAGAFGRSHVFHTCEYQSLLKLWFDRSQHLEVYASQGMRTAYDCAPKRCRAQLLCLLNRALMCEAKRCHGCVRGAWSQIMQTFPELGVWREFRGLLEGRVWDCSCDPPYVPRPEKSPSRDRKRQREKEEKEREKEREKRRRAESTPQDPEGKEKDRKWDARWRSTDDTSGQAAATEPENKKSERESTRECREAVARNPATGALASRWARRWRTAMASVLPSASAGGAPQTDEQLRKLAAALWRDVLQALAKSGLAERGLGLLLADPPEMKAEGAEVPPPPRGMPPGTPACEWAYLPMADLLLIVGEGLVGSTVEGFFVEKPMRHQRKPFASCYKKASDYAKAVRRKRDQRSDDRNGNDKGGASKWDLH